jgi:AraC-like DNA-binding protein
LIVGTLSYSAQVRVNTEELTTAYEINVPLAGHVASWVGSRPVTRSPTVAAVTPPTFSSTLHGFGPGATLVGLKIDRRSMEAHAGLVAGRPWAGPVPFPETIDLRQPEAQRWWARTRALVDALFADGPRYSATAAAPVVADVLTGLLLLGGIDPAEAAAPPGTVRFAAEYLREHAAEAVTMSGLAGVCHCSVRALQAGFRLHFDCSPMTYLHRIRLAGVHADLVGAHPDEESVTELCHRWGFTHQGRFSVAYKAVFGVCPSDTLRS